MCMSLCIYFIYLCMQTHTNIQICIYKYCINLYEHTNTYIFVSIYIHIHICMSTHTHANVLYKNLFTCAFILSLLVYLLVFTQKSVLVTLSACMNAFANVCPSLCIYLYVFFSVSSFVLFVHLILVSPIRAPFMHISSTYLLIGGKSFHFSKKKKKYSLLVNLFKYNFSYIISPS